MLELYTYSREWSERATLEDSLLKRNKMTEGKSETWSGKVSANYLA